MKPCRQTLLLIAGPREQHQQRGARLAQLIKLIGQPELASRLDKLRQSS